jgi:type IV secretory pathway VirB10-like protein
MRFEDDPDITEWRPDPGRAPGMSPRKIGIVVFCTGCLVVLYLFAPFESWFSRIWASFNTPTPSTAPVAVTAPTDQDLAGLAQHYVPKLPLSPTRAVEAAPVVETPDTSMYDSLKAQYDHLQGKYADLEAWVKGQGSKPVPQQTNTPKATIVDEENKKREEEAKKQRETLLKSKTGFLTRPKDEKVGQLHALKSPYSLAPSETIPCETTMQISSDTPGAFVAIVAKDMPDTATRQQIVIPKGSKFVMKPRGRLIFGDSRVDIQTQTLTFPGGSWLKTPAHTVTDAAGTSGFTGEIDRHYARIFGSVVITGVLRGGTTVATGGYGGDPAERIAGAVAQEGAAEGTRQARQFQRTDPTITIPGPKRQDDGTVTMYQCQLLLEEELILTRSFGRLQP